MQVMYSRSVSQRVCTASDRRSPWYSARHGVAHTAVLSRFLIDTLPWQRVREGRAPETSQVDIQRGETLDNNIAENEPVVIRNTRTCRSPESRKWWLTWRWRPGRMSARCRSFERWRWRLPLRTAPCRPCWPWHRPEAQTASRACRDRGSPPNIGTLSAERQCYWREEQVDNVAPLIYNDNVHDDW